LIHSFAILYVAASLSRTVELALYLVLFAALVLAVFFTAEKETGLKRARLRPMSIKASAPQRRVPTPGRSMTIFGFSFGLIVIPAIVLAFLFTPRFSNNPIVPPFTLNIPLRGGISAEIINPGVPLVQVNGWSNEVGDYFIGFDTNLDLRYRGGLSDAVVMYVRSPSRSYWRSHSYDTYTGVTWTQSDDRLIEVKRRVGVVYELGQPLGELNWKTDSNGNVSLVITKASGGAKNAGTRLIRRLDGYKSVTTINLRVAPGGSQQSLNSTNESNGVGSDSIVEINLTNKRVYGTFDENTGISRQQDTPVWITLAHELIHADHAARGTTLIGTGTYSYKDTNGRRRTARENRYELATVGIEGLNNRMDITENDIRKEQGLRVRSEY
jgi:hypothetical protein